MRDDGETRLTAEQRAEVERHLRLVWLQLRRQPGRPQRRETIGREQDDLFQEGALELARAVARHRPRAHGAFAPYALARIHYAMSRWIHEQRSGVRVPLATQKRQRQRRRSRHDPRGGWRPRPAGTPAKRPRLRDDPRVDPVHGVDDVGQETLGAAVRERINAALRRVQREATGDDGRRGGRGRLVDAIVAGRLGIADAALREPVRAMARRLGASLGRVTRAEAWCADRARALLERDAAFRYLRFVARRRRYGFDSRLGRRDAERLARLESRAALKGRRRPAASREGRGLRGRRRDRVVRRS